MHDSHRLDPAARVALREVGLSASHVLRRAGLPPDLLTRQSPTVTTEGFFRLWQAIGEEGDDAMVAVTLGRIGAQEVFSPPLLAALASPDLTTAARRIARFKDLVAPITMTVLANEEGTTITMRGKGYPMPIALALADLSFLVHFARRATRTPIRPTRASLPEHLANASAIEEKLGVRFLKGPDMSVTFSAADTYRPFLTADEETWRFFKPVLTQRLTELDASASLTDRVVAALVEMLPSGRSTVKDVAEMLAVSPRTLQRHLRREGTTFQRALATTRERLARHYLQSSDMATAEVALLLGYDDPNSFYRAFHTWTGTTPQRAREAMAEQESSNGAIH